MVCSCELLRGPVCLGLVSQGPQSLPAPPHCADSRGLLPYVPPTQEAMCCGEGHRGRRQGKGTDSVPVWEPEIWNLSVEGAMLPRSSASGSPQIFIHSHLCLCHHTASALFMSLGLLWLLKGHLLLVLGPTQVTQNELISASNLRYICKGHFVK